MKLLAFYSSKSLHYNKKIALIFGVTTLALSSSSIFALCFLALGNFDFGRKFSFQHSNFHTDTSTVSPATVFTFVGFLTVHSTT